MADYSIARRAMVDQQIATSGVTDPRLLSVLNRVPRERFVPPASVRLAYSDAPIPLGDGRVLPAPAVFARLVQLAAIQKTERVLDYWSGSGYSTAVLAGLGRTVVGYEPDADLADAFRTSLIQAGVDNVIVATDADDKVLDGPFDVIVLEGAVAAVSDFLIERVAPGGRIVAVVSSGPVGVATIYERELDGVVARGCFNATLPAAPGIRGPEVFVF